MNQIDFTINYEAGQKRKLEEFVARFCKQTQQTPHGLVVERYPKFDRQFQARFTWTLNETRRQDVVYQMLLWAKELSGSTKGDWAINGPYELESLSFECIFNGEADNQPLKWAHIRIEN